MEIQTQSGECQSPALSFTDGETEAQREEETSGSYPLVKGWRLPTGPHLWHLTHCPNTSLGRNHGNAVSPRPGPGPAAEPAPALWLLAVFSWHRKTVTRARGQEMSKEGLKGPGQEADPKQADLPT